MSRQPAHIELTGGKGPRQLMWEAIRGFGLGKPFGWIDVVGQDINTTTAKTYLRALQKAGYIERVEKGGRAPDGRYLSAQWILVRDTGIEAPRLTKQGKPVTAGRGVENMWQAIRNFLPTFDWRELAAYASTDAHPVSLETAKVWTHTLHAAGYLIEIEPSRPGKTARFRLDPSMNTGPRPPQIQRTKTVYDPNLGKVVWREEPDWEALS